MKIPKYKIGDKIFVRGETRIIQAIDIHIRKFNTTVYYFYNTNLSRRWDYAIHEDAIVLAPRYEVGDKVWLMHLGEIYHGVVTNWEPTTKTFDVRYQTITIVRKAADLHPTKESLIESIPCHDHQI